MGYGSEAASSVKSPKQKELRVKEEIINLFVKHSNRDYSSIFHSITCTLELEKWREMFFSSISYVKSPMWTWKASTRAINETCLYNDVIECEARRVFPLSVQTFTNILCTCIKREKSLWKAFSFFINSFLSSLRWKEGKQFLVIIFQMSGLRGDYWEDSALITCMLFSSDMQKFCAHKNSFEKKVHEWKKEAIEITKRKDYSNTLFCLNNFARWGVKREFPFKQFLHFEKIWLKVKAIESWIILKRVSRLAHSWTDDILYWNWITAILILVFRSKAFVFNFSRIEMNFRLVRIWKIIF